MKIAVFDKKILLLQLFVLILLFCEVTLKRKPSKRNVNKRLNENIGQVQNDYKNKLRNYNRKQAIQKEGRYRIRKNGRSMKEKTGKGFKKNRRNQLTNKNIEIKQNKRMRRKQKKGGNYYKNKQRKEKMKKKYSKAKNNKIKNKWKKKNGKNYKNKNSKRLKKNGQKKSGRKYKKGHLKKMNRKKKRGKMNIKGNNKQLKRKNKNRTRNKKFKNSSRKNSKNRKKKLRKNSKKNIRNRSKNRKKKQNKKNKNKFRRQQMEEGHMKHPERNDRGREVHSRSPERGHGRKEEYSRNPERGYGRKEEYTRNPERGYGRKEEYSRNPERGHGRKEEYTRNTKEGHNRLGGNVESSEKWKKPDKSGKKKKALEARNDTLHNEVAMTCAYQKMQTPWSNAIAIAPAIVSILSQLTVIGSNNDFKLRPSPTEKLTVLTENYYSSAVNQLGTSASDGFNMASKNTGIIRDLTGNIGSHVGDVLAILDEGSLENIHDNLPYELGSILDISTNCSKAASEVEMQFEQTMVLITEMSKVFGETKSENSDEMKQLAKERIYLQNNLTNAKNIQSRLDANKKKMNQRLMDQQARYDKALADIPTGWQAALQTFVTNLNPGKMMMSAAEVLMAVNPEAQLGRLAGGVTSGMVDDVQENKFSDETAFQASANTVETLNNYKEVLEDLETKIEAEVETPEGASSKISDLTDNFGKLSGVVTDTVASLPDGKPKKLCEKFLSKTTDKLKSIKKSFLESPNKAISLIRNLYPQVEQMIAPHLGLASAGSMTNHETQMKSHYLPEEQAQFQPGSNAKMIASMQSEQLTQVRAEDDKAEKDLLNEMREVNAMSAKLSNMNVTSLDLNHTIALVSAAFKHLSTLKDLWNQLTSFFQNLASFVQNKLSDTLNTFRNFSASTAKEAKSGKKMFASTKQILFDNAFKAEAMGDAAYTMADTYNKFATTYLNDQMNSIGELASLEQFQMNAKMKELEKNRQVATDYIKVFVEKQRTDFRKKLTQQKKNIDQVFGIVGQPSSSTKNTIRIGMEAAKKKDYSRIEALA